MSEVWKQIAVDRDIQDVDRHYFDLILEEKGIRANFIWKTGQTFRTPFSLVTDFIKRKSLSNISIEEAKKLDEKHFFIDFEEIQGIVNDDLHKEFQILTSSELVRIIFRKIDKYDSFLAVLKTKVNEKIHSREKKVVVSSKLGY